MNTSIFNLQNMADMHKGYAYQIFNYVAYKTFTRVQLSLPKQNQHEQNQKQITGEGIEPNRTLPNYNKSFLPNHTPHKTHHNLTKLIIINLQFFKQIMFFNQVVIFLY